MEADHTDTDEDEDSELWEHFCFPELTPEEDAQLTIALQGGGTPQQTTSNVETSTSVGDTDSAAKLRRHEAIRAALVADISGNARRSSASTSQSASATVVDNHSRIRSGPGAAVVRDMDIAGRSICNAVVSSPTARRSSEMSASAPMYSPPPYTESGENNNLNSNHLFYINNVPISSTDGHIHIVRRLCH